MIEIGRVADVVADVKYVFYCLYLDPNAVTEEEGISCRKDTEKYRFGLISFAHFSLGPFSRRIISPVIVSY
jgi:hypothetical protein